MIYIIGPGHGGPAIVAQAYMEGTYREIYPDISQGLEGMKRLFKQFSFPGGIPSHVAPEMPGSIHEGGELGYALSHAYGAAFDNPNLIVACVVGDGEAETGPLATGWHGNKFLNPERDRCVLPILHLNGYKIANPCFLAGISNDELKKLFEIKSASGQNAIKASHIRFRDGKLGISPTTTFSGIGVPTFPASSATNCCSSGSLRKSFILPTTVVVALLTTLNADPIIDTVPTTAPKPIANKIPI